MELTTQRLLLRELLESDAEMAHRYESNPDVVRYQSNGVRSLEESRAHILKSQAQAQELPRRVFDLAVTLADRRYIGRVGLGVQDAEGGQGMLWWVIDPAYQGQGFAHEAAVRLIRFGFVELGLHRIYIDVDPRNTASVRLAEKLGMRREGLLREAAFIKGEWVDSMILALLAQEHGNGAR